MTRSLYLSSFIALFITSSSPAFSTNTDSTSKTVVVQDKEVEITLCLNFERHDQLINPGNYTYKHNAALGLYKTQKVNRLAFDFPNPEPRYLVFKSESPLSAKFKRGPYTQQLLEMGWPQDQTSFDISANQPFKFVNSYTDSEPFKESGSLIALFYNKPSDLVLGKWAPVSFLIDPHNNECQVAYQEVEVSAPQGGLEKIKVNFSYLKEDTQFNDAPEYFLIKVQSDLSSIKIDKKPNREPIKKDNYRVQPGKRPAKSF